VIKRFGGAFALGRLHPPMSIGLVVAVAVMIMLGIISCQSSGGKGQTAQRPEGTMPPAVGTALIGRPVQKTGTVLGSLSGSLAGGVIGNYLERQDRDRTAAAIALSYLPEQGELLKIESVEASPPSTRRGDNVNLTSTYTVLTPHNRPMTIRETREVRHKGSLVADLFIDVVRSSGTFTSILPIILPPNAKPGTYEVTTTVSKDQRTSRSITNFTVQ
jgi:hypothetical protein